jgi:dihydrofolate reductase
MRKIIAITQVTVDAVMQAPGGSEEDRRSGFNYGGWAMPFVDGSLNIVETIRDYDLLLGRVTYDIFAGYWPHQDNAIATAFNKATTYVVTHRPNNLGRGDLGTHRRRYRRGVPQAQGIGWARVAHMG